MGQANMKDGRKRVKKGEEGGYSSTIMETQIST